MVNKVHTSTVVTLDTTIVGAVATVLQGVGAEPGFTAPSEEVVAEDRRLGLGPYGVATVMVRKAKSDSHVEAPRGLASPRALEPKSHESATLF